MQPAFKHFHYPSAEGRLARGAQSKEVEEQGMAWLMKAIDWISTLWSDLNRSDLSLVSAGIAFFAFLSVFPAIAAVIAIWGFAFNPAAIQSQLELTKDYLPSEAYALLADQVTRLLAINSRDLGLTTLISTGVALWSSRAGVGTLSGAINTIHGFPPRHSLWHIIHSLFLTFLLVGLVLGAMALAVVTPLTLALLPIGPWQSFILQSLNFSLGLLLVMGAVALAYRLSPNWPKGVTPDRLLTPGLFIAVLLWALVSRGLVFYLSNFANYSKIYGSIGAVVALMFWIWLSTFAVLLGASSDVVINERRKARAERKAADTALPQTNEPAP